jgi:AcrR family transcriptional regulator
MSDQLDEQSVQPRQLVSPQSSAARLPLSRDRIVAAAVAFIDERGLAGLSMRRLGKSLDVEAMSLYRYVPGREDLLDAVVESIIDEMYGDPQVLVAPEDGWQDFVQRLAHGVRRVALAHPKAFPLVASRPTEAPWLRPPLRSLKWVELFLDALLREGFSEDAAVVSYRAFTTFLLGHLLLEVSTRGAVLSPLDEEATHEEIAEGEGGVDQSGLEEYPRVRALSYALREDHSLVEFEEALENLLDRLTLLRSEG